MVLLNRRLLMWTALTITLFAFVLRAFRLGVQSMWWDEVYVATISRSPDWLGWVFIEERSHPPGFFFIMSMWTQLGVGEFIMRFPSVVWGTLSVPMIYSIGSRLGGCWVGILGALLLAVSPYDVWYSQEARMYAPQIFFALLSSYLFLRLIANGGGRMNAAIAATSTAGLYLYYLFPLVLLGQLVFLILFRRRYQAAARHWLVANGIAGILFLPWLTAIFATGGFARAAIAWIPPAQWYDPVLSLYTLVVGTTSNPRDALNWLAPLIFAGLGAFAIWSGRRGPRRDAIVYLLLWLLIPFGLVFLVSLPIGAADKRSLYSDRYLLPELPALLLLVSFGAAPLLRAKSRPFAFILVLAALPLFISLGEMYLNPAYARDDWRSASAYLAANADPARDELALEASLTWPYSYYDQAHLARIAFYADPSRFDQAMAANPKPDAKRLWLLTATIPGSAHRFSPSEAGQLATANLDFGKSVLDRRYTIESERLFQGILVTRYRVQP